MWAVSCVEKRVRFAIGLLFCCFVIMVLHALATSTGDNKNMSFGQRDAAEECVNQHEESARVCARGTS